MSDTVVLRGVLVGSAALIAVVPAAKIYFGGAPQGAELPALVLNTISIRERKTLDDAATFVQKTARTQVTVLAKSYTQQKDLIRLVGLAVKGGPRVVAGIKVDNIIRDIEGPDMSDDDAKIFVQTRDFRVIYYAPK